MPEPGSAHANEYRSVVGIAVYREPIGTANGPAVDEDTHNILRKPDARLYLMVKKPREEHAWQFPQGGLKTKKQETLEAGALRELSEECGSDLQVQLIDKEQPACVYQYAFPPEFIEARKRKKLYMGSRVQFLRARWIRGNCQPDGVEIVDYAWVTHSEMDHLVSDEYRNGVSSLFKQT